MITACWEEAWLWVVTGDNTVEATQYLQHQSSETDVSSVRANLIQKGRCAQIIDCRGNTDTPQWVLHSFTNIRK